MESPLKFAVVREDPQIESQLVERASARSLLTVASGGCTALSLAQRHPQLAVTAFDLNPAQLAHLRLKSDAARRGDLLALNVGDASPEGLNQRGEFEKLFRVLRAYLHEFVCVPDEVARFFDGGASSTRWFSSRYWSAAFDVAFTDALLNAMFGPAATQHAEPGSYPRYFQSAFERGLSRDDARDNPFLQHVLLGSYLPRSAPGYTALRHEPDITLINASLPDVPDLARFDVFSLSNVFDWGDDALVTQWADALIARARPGSAVLIRQLNNTRDVRRFFAPHFRFDDALGAAFCERDRSLFYNRIEVAFRVG